MKKIIKYFIPPVFFDILRYLHRMYKKIRKNNVDGDFLGDNRSVIPLSQPQLADNNDISPTFEYILEGWSHIRNHPELIGWNAPAILDIYLKRWDLFKSKLQETGPLGFSPEGDPSTLNINHHNINMSFAYSFGLACQQRRNVSFLDWGGSVGHYFLIAKALFPHIDINYCCKDIAVFSDMGRSLLPNAFFYNDDQYLKGKFDFVLVSGALQYVCDWRSELQKIASVAEQYLFITRLPIILIVPSFVFVQRPYSIGYNTEYLAWAINRDEILQMVESLGFELVREFITGESHSIENAPEQCSYQGFLFVKIGT